MDSNGTPRSESTDKRIGWDLRSVASVPDGTRKFFDQVKVSLRNRETGEVVMTTTKSHNPWIAICFAIRDITGVNVDDQQGMHDSLLLFASSAMIDVNRHLAAEAKKKEEQEWFPWPENASIDGGGSRIAGKTRGEEIILISAAAR